MEPSTYMERLWDQGQRHLAAGRYIAARLELEAAERIAWRRRDAGALARMYLPLLEVRRQIRYLAVEGKIVIAGPGTERWRGAAVEAAAGTFLFVDESGLGGEKAVAVAGAMIAAGVRSGRCIEALVILTHGGERRLVCVVEPVFAAGIPAVLSLEGGDIAASTDADFFAALPPEGVYDGQMPSAGENAREALLIAWEALGLRWQQRHVSGGSRGANAGIWAGWAELEWLRAALRIDPASEPITMRLISLAESMARMG